MWWHRRRSNSKLFEKNYFRIVVSLARSHNKSHILKNLTKDVSFEDVTDKYACIGIFGPNSEPLTELFGNFLKKISSFLGENFLKFMEIKFGFKDYHLLENLVGKFTFQLKVQSYF